MPSPSIIADARAVNTPAVIAAVCTTTEHLCVCLDEGSGSGSGSSSLRGMGAVTFAVASKRAAAHHPRRPRVASDAVMCDDPRDRMHVHVSEYRHK
eukprot:6192221-Pleurochrysis_carterae.AAC.6